MPPVLNPDGYGWRPGHSNFPMIMPGECLAQVDTLGLDDEAKRLFLGENATRVFGLG